MPQQNRCCSGFVGSLRESAPTTPFLLSICWVTNPGFVGALSGKCPNKNGFVRDLLGHFSDFVGALLLGHFSDFVGHFCWGTFRILLCRGFLGTVFVMSGILGYNFCYVGKVFVTNISLLRLVRFVWAFVFVWLFAVCYLFVGYLLLSWKSISVIN